MGVTFVDINISNRPGVKLTVINSPPQRREDYAWDLQVVAFGKKDFVYCRLVITYVNLKVGSCGWDER
jgi:hypothetical protein